MNPLETMQKAITSSEEIAEHVGKLDLAATLNDMTVRNDGRASSDMLLLLVATLRSFGCDPDVASITMGLAFKRVWRLLDERGVTSEQVQAMPTQN